MSGAKAKTWAGFICPDNANGYERRQDSMLHVMRSDIYEDRDLPVMVVPTPRYEAMVAKAAAFDAMVHVDREGTPMFDLTKGGEGGAQPNYRHMPKRTRALAAAALARVDAQEESDG